MSEDMDKVNNPRVLSDLLTQYFVTFHLEIYVAFYIKIVVTHMKIRVGIHKTSYANS